VVDDVSVATKDDGLTDAFVECLESLARKAALPCSQGGSYTLGLRFQID
jgi:hypothetical protein